MMMMMMMIGHTVSCVYVPPPASVSISSFNMEHILSFLPSPHTPTDAHFTVQVTTDRKKAWRSVTSCSHLVSGQTCNLTRTFRDPFDHYRARVQTVTPMGASDWTVSEEFQPVSNTVLSTPVLSVSGCGNCLIVHLQTPDVHLSDGRLKLEDLYSTMTITVRRSSDGTQFSVTLPFSNQTTVRYLQSQVHYCVSVSVVSFFSSTPSTSQTRCSFTSFPPTAVSLTSVLVAVLAILTSLVVGLMVCGRRRLATNTLTACLLPCHSSS
ncbi:interferon alpha/beta receptor 2-like isoform 1-T1 [Pholidichthys leucotaenia]